MAILSLKVSEKISLYFVFKEKQILVKRSDGLSLPNLSDLNSFISKHFVSDYFTETGKNYTAAFLNDDFVLPSDFEFIMLREYFWRTKNDAQKENALPSFLGELSARAHGFLNLRKMYKFCPSCAGSLVDDSYFAARRCTSCNTLLFPRIEPCVIILVSKGDEVLLVKSKTNASEYFSCVAGFIEHGESAEQTAEREVLEETGIGIKNLRYVGSQAWPFPDQLMLAFTAEYRCGEIKIQEEEIESAAWFKKVSLPKTPPPGSVAYNLIHGLFSV